MYGTKMFLLHSTANLYKLYIIVMVVKNKWNDLGSNDNFLPHFHRLKGHQMLHNYNYKPLHSLVLM